LRGGWQPSLSLELALAEVLDVPNEPVSRPVAPPPSAAVPTQPQTASVPQPGPPQAHQVLKEETEAVLHQDVELPHPVEKSSVNAGDIIKGWKHLSASLPKAQANLSALLNSVKMIDVQGKTLILGLASDVLVSKIDKPDQIEAIQKLIKDEFGVEMNVRCVVTTARGKIPPNVQQDGMVAAAIQHGGQIVDI
jgi:hypothetical protein